MTNSIQLSTSISELNLPKGRQRLAPQLRRDVKDRYEQDILQFMHAVHADQREELLEKLTSLESSATAWLRSLGTYCRVLARIWEEEACQVAGHSSDAYRVIGACLAYLVDPEDVIPDYICGLGYLDDAYVVELCLKRLSRRHRIRFFALLDAQDAT